MKCRWQLSCFLFHAPSKGRGLGEEAGGEVGVGRTRKRGGGVPTDQITSLPFTFHYCCSPDTMDLVCLSSLLLLSSSPSSSTCSRLLLLLLLLPVLFFFLLFFQTGKRDYRWKDDFTTVSTGPNLSPAPSTLSPIFSYLPCLDGTTP